MPKLSKYQQHCNDWLPCQLCNLHKHRKHTVLLRGTVPSAVLFVGEAPGEGEDVLGAPFVGPAGKLLDRIIERAGGNPTRMAFTNLIACIPRDEHQNKLTKPPKYAVDACRSRLTECLGIVNPELIVWVGSEAKKYGPKAVPEKLLIPTVDIVHPAAILRAHITQQGLMVQRCVVTLSEAFLEL